jgi:hypothetical protein
MARAPQSRSKLDLASLVKGDYTGQTANGTAKAGNEQSGWNRQMNWPPAPQVPSEGPWSGNRSAE